MLINKHLDLFIDVICWLKLCSKWDNLLTVPKVSVITKCRKLFLFPPLLQKSDLLFWKGVNSDFYVAKLHVHIKFKINLHLMLLNSPAIIDHVYRTEEFISLWSCLCKIFVNCLFVYAVYYLYISCIVVQMYILFLRNL